jgi:IS605 OrfB family transposase
VNAFDRAHPFIKAAQNTPSFSAGENTPVARQRARYLHQHDILVFLMKMCATDCMQQIVTAKLKLQTTPEQFRALRTTQLAYRDALNYVSRYAFAHGKMSNKVGLQEGTYQQIRARFGLPAQMACSVPRQVGATYKTLWTRAKANAEARTLGRTKKRYKGLDRAPKYISPTLTYQLGHDFGFKTVQRVSLLTLDGRVIVPYVGYARHVTLIQQGAPIGAAKLWYDKSHKQFYLLVSLEVEVVDPTVECHQRIVGVDVGQRYLAVATDTQNQTAFYAGKQVRAKADHYARLRKRLQRKGTRSATRRLMVVSGRERRLKQDRNHLISRRIVDAYPHSLIGLENLTYIRERAKRRHGKKASAKQRKANHHASKWAFAELHSYIAYKALLAGSMAVKVDAYCTSQACPRCGHTTPQNRPAKGLLFVCQACDMTLHADLIGARNIALRTLLVRQDWASTGGLSERPDVSDDEAKAVRRRRYAELRWSLDTSSQL